MPVAAAVLFAASLHATWNALVKSVGDRLALMAAMGISSVAICVPTALLVAPPHARAWPELGTSIVLQAIYNVLLIESYREGDYNQVYPVARGIAPPAVAIASAVLLGESLTLVQAAGVLTVTAGLAVLAAGSCHEPRRALVFAALTGLVIASYTVVDGVGVRRSGSVLGYASWLFIGSGALMPMILAAFNARSAHPSRITRRLVGQAVIADVLSLIAYGLVLWAQTKGALAVVAALRETSVVFAAMLGATVFHEQLPARRILGSVVVAAGAAALALG